MSFPKIVKLLLFLILMTMECHLKDFVTNMLKPAGDRRHEKFKDLHFPQYADAYSYKYMWKYTD